MAALKTIALFCADDQRSACLMLRVLGPARELGWQVLAGNRWQAKRLVDFSPQVVDDADLVIIQRDFPRYASAYETVMARARAAEKPVIYEIDDLLFELPAEHPVRAYYRAARLPMLRAALEASAIVVSSRGLADYLRPFNSRIWLLPNYLDDRLWPLVQPPEPDRGPVVLGYMGGFTHAPDAALIERALLNCLDTFGERVRLKYWSQAMPPASLAGHRNVEWVNIAISDYAEFAQYFARQTCDIALAPLRNSRFNECKSAIKFLEYSAIGAAGVYSRLPPYEDVITHDQDGLLAATLEDWQACLIRLIEQPALRRQMARAAQRTVRERWLLSNGAQGWAEAYQSVRDDRASGQPAQSLAVLELVQRWMEEQAADLRQEAQDQMAQLTGRPSWKIAQSLQAVRMGLAPAGSRRERALDRLLRAWTSRRSPARR